MEGAPGVVVLLEFVGVLVFAVDGGLMAVRDRRMDIIGVFGLALVTALGGGFVRDALLGATPAGALVDLRYLATAAVGGGLAFVAARLFDRLGRTISVLDALGLSLFAVTGTAKALGYGLPVLASVLLGTISAVGGGMIRDLCLTRVPVVLHRDTVLYAVPAMAGSAAVVAFTALGLWNWVWPLLAAALAMAIRLASLRWHITAPARSWPDGDV